ncbi:hypothetical protein, partial [Bilophila wadsworthia]|uniref:hypothetical protein n=1 Tax=Bilophila wadsworthia TaxID=35833 RepID=UPI00321FE551
MLTEKERKWLENRDDVCFRCSKNKRTCSQALRKICLDIWFPIKDRALMKEPDYRDAAEFEARVAEKLTL